MQKRQVTTNKCLCVQTLKLSRRHNILHISDDIRQKLCDVFLIVLSIIQTKVSNIVWGGARTPS